MQVVELEKERTAGEASSLGRPGSDPQPKSAGRGAKHWRVLAGMSALVLTLLTLAGVRLITNPSKTVDQLVILTIPSGALVTFDSKELGRSPVKLEEVGVGMHVLEITKEGFQKVVDQIEVSESDTVDYRLKAESYAEAAGLPPEEQIRQYKRLAEEALLRADYALPHEGSALYYANLILGIDSSQQDGLRLRERVRVALHSAAQAAAARGDLAQAQESYAVLAEFFPEDETARLAGSKLESQLLTRHSEVREFIKKAEQAMDAGRITDPPASNAYYYAKQALAVDRQNTKAREILARIKEIFLTDIQQLERSGDTEALTRKLKHATQLFRDDKSIAGRYRVLESRDAEAAIKLNDPAVRRQRGLEKYARGEYYEAIPHLEFAAANKRNTPDVLFALGHSYYLTGDLERAAHYLRDVPKASKHAYASATAILGDISAKRDDSNAALVRYKEARDAGGSTLYSIDTLNDKIERLERRYREKSGEIAPFTMRVSHNHTGFWGGGSCTGTLTVSSTLVRYAANDGKHQFSNNPPSVTGIIGKNELTLAFGDKHQKFKVSRDDAVRFMNALDRIKVAQQQRPPGS